MLLSLQIKNYLLIEQVNLELSKKLSVLTGETGAGKSIILSSINFILGAKSDSKIIKKGNKEAEVTAIFEIANNLELKGYLNSIDFNDDDLIITRKIDINNKNKIFIGDRLINLTILKKISSYLVEIHGQHEQSSLIDSKNHKIILDEFSSYTQLLNDVAQKYHDWKSAEIELKKQISELELLNKEKDYLKHLVNELTELNLKVDEEEELAIKRSQLQGKDKTISALSSAINEITQLSQVEKSIINAGKYLSRNATSNEDEFEEIHQAFDRSLVEISEALNLLEIKRNDLLNSEEDIEEIEKRLFLIKSLSKKYNTASNELPKFLSESIIKLDKINSSDKNLKQLEKTYLFCKDQYFTQAKELSLERKASAQILCDKVQEELNFLKMEKAKFKVDFKELSEFEANKEGIDKIKFQAITNPGQDFNDITKIASGGELSRFMLALKVIISRKKSNLTLIFDEIDSGIGGAVADLVGNRLSKLSANNQILLITHQAQIAAKAQTHIYVEKIQNENETTSFVRNLTIEDIYNELARMLAGNNITNEVREVAKQLTKNINI